MSNHYNPNLWKKANEAKTGDIIQCPSCGKKHRKRCYQHKFCGKRCKDNYWNDEPKRRERSAILGFGSLSEEDEFQYDPGWDAHKDLF